MSMCARLLLLALFLSIAGTEAAQAEWKYLAPGKDDRGVHRVFAFAEKSDDRLEIACNAKRRDLFYSTKRTVSKADLKKMNGGEPAIVIRMGVGVVPIKADEAYQKGNRLYFTVAVSPAFFEEFGKTSKTFAAGLRANGEIIQQDMYSAKRLKASLDSMAKGCGF